MQSTRVLRRTVLSAALAGIAATTTVAGPAFAADPTGSISGIVRDTRGAAVSYASISVYLNTSSGPVQERPADTDGRFTITGLKAGSYKILIGLTGWSEWAPGQITDPELATSYQVTANRTTNADSVITAPGFIAGRLLGPDGRPAANSAVNVTNVNNASGNGGVTAADGSYRLRVQPRQTFIVSYSVAGLTEYVPHTFHPAEAKRYFVRSGQTVRVNDRAIDVSGMSGRLTDAAGAPAGNVNVSFINVDTADQSDTSTAADGTYDFSRLLVPGRYKVRFFASGRSQYAHQKPDYDSADVITLKSGETTIVDDQLLWIPTPQQPES